ncbi:beta strand repeat-containing protein, partial [Aquabacter spiritensis]|uniref:beta strand repeat-containing protein n=1 Tax=Aquabacter spiritensis TaxID=933073 RepID=UPI001A9E9A14
MLGADITGGAGGAGGGVSVGMVLVGSTARLGDGGAGGAGFISQVSGLVLNNYGAITGGAGGMGGVVGANYIGAPLYAGNAGAGGAGTAMSGESTSFTNDGIVTGGAGGNVDSTITPSPGFGNMPGAGGAGLLLSGTATTSNTTVQNYGTITGGVGGHDLNAGVGSYGLSGAGVVISGTLNTFTNYNTGVVAGADLPTGATGADYGGVGLLISGDDNTVTNYGTIRSGSDNVVGESGVAISVTGSSNKIINDGSINSPNDFAVYFANTSLGSTLELQSNWSLVGGARNLGANTTLALGGTVDQSFDQSLIGSSLIDFDNYDKVGTATWTLTNTGTVTWTVREGTLALGAASSMGGATVMNGAILTSLSGAFSTGTVTIQNGGTLAGGPGASAVGLAITGSNDLILSPTSLLSLTLDPTRSTTAAVSSANLTLDGTLYVIDGGSFGAGTYTLLSYTGSLTNNTLDVGVLPNGLTGTISVATSGVVLLIIASPGLYWNGGVTTAGGSSVVGGDGTWNAGNTNWTDSAGATAVAWDGSTAIFAGTSSSNNVTVVGAPGVISVEGMQFDVDGYNISGDSITLAATSGQTGIDVATSVTATIGSVLAGTTGLQKTGAGTLNLSGTNSLTGDVTVSAGTLGLSGTLGASVLTVGSADAATLAVSGGGALTSINSTVGTADGGVGTVTVSGTNSSWTSTGELTIGLNGGAGSLTISGGAQFSAQRIGLSTASWQSGSGGNGALTVTGTDTLWTNSDGGIEVARTAGATGSLTVSGGATAQIYKVGIYTGAGAQVTFTGAGTRVEIGDPDDPTNTALQAGLSPDGGTVTISDRAEVYATQVYVGAAGGDLVTMTVSGASLVAEKFLYVGGQNGTRNVDPVNGNGDLTISAGGTVTGGATGVGMDPGSQGKLTITGAGSQFWAKANPTFSYLGNLYVGYAGTASVIVADGGTLKVDNEVRIGYTADGDGVLAIGAASGSAAAAGVIDAPSIVFGAGAGEIVFNHTATDFTLSAAISGGGALSVLAGTTILTGASTYTGGTTISGGVLAIGGASGSIDGDVVLSNGGTLTLARTTDMTFTGVVSGTGSLTKTGTAKATLMGANTFAGTTTVYGGTLELLGGSLAGGVSVNSGATLKGAAAPGTVSGDVNIAAGATLVGVSGATSLSIGGKLSFADPTSIFAVTLGSPSPTTPAIDVGGDLVLTGVLNLTAGVGFFSGTYRLIDYDGTLSGAGLEVGTAPTHSLFAVSTATANQVNLLVAAGQWWNGTTTSPGSSVQGGVGTWNVSAPTTNWTDQTGTSASSWSQGGLAIFAGTAGTVTVAGMTAPQVAAMEFLTDGYVIEGGSITLSSFASSGVTRITVGDGTGPSASWTATIASELTGTQILSKNGAGTLVLTGANSYTDITRINEGTLSIGNGGTTGSVASPEIANSSELVFNRSSYIAYAGVISGIGTLEKTGAGTLELSGANTYLGDTTVTAGTLRIASAGALGTSAAGTTVASGATLEIFGSGPLALGAEALTLSGTGVNGAGALLSTDYNNSVAGAINLAADSLVSVTAGTLTLTGGVTGSGMSLTLGGAGQGQLSSVVATGTGGVTKQGAGVWYLNGANTYTGATTISEGALVATNAASLGTAAGGTSVAAGAALWIGGGVALGAEAVTLSGAA